MHQFFPSFGPVSCGTHLSCAEVIKHRFVVIEEELSLSSLWAEVGLLDIVLFSVE